jgi:hypothetical protein
VVDSASNRYFRNSTLFAVSTSTFSKPCKKRMQWHVEECPVANRFMASGGFWDLTEMSTWNVPGSKARPSRKADNLPASVSHCLENVGASMSHKYTGLHDLLQGIAVPYIYIFGRKIPLLPGLFNCAKSLRRHQPSGSDVNFGVRPPNRCLPELAV